MEKQYEIIVYGRVQGVGFRYAAQAKARLLRLRGWIKNLPDGSVKTVIKGEEQACREFIQWCRTGTGYSWVERLDVLEQKPEGLGPFTITR